jgi:hypothetical protein
LVGRILEKQASDIGLAIDNLSGKIMGRAQGLSMKPQGDLAIEFPR